MDTALSLSPLRSIAVVLSVATMALLGAAVWSQKSPSTDGRVPRGVVATSPWAEDLKMAAAAIVHAGAERGTFDEESLLVALGERSPLRYETGPTSTSDVVSVAVLDPSTAAVAVLTDDGKCQLARVSLDERPTKEYLRAPHGPCHAARAGATS